MKKRFTSFLAVIIACAGMACMQGCEEDSQDKSNELNLLVLAAYSDSRSDSRVETIWPGTGSTFSGGFPFDIDFTGSLQSTDYGTLKLGGIAYKNLENCTMTTEMSSSGYRLHVSIPAINYGKYVGLSLTGFKDGEGKPILPHYNLFYTITIKPK